MKEVTSTHRTVRKLEKFDTADVVHAVRRTSAPIENMNRAIRILGDLIL